MRHIVEGDDRVFKHRQSDDAVYRFRAEDGRCIVERENTKVDVVQREIAKFHLCDGGASTMDSLLADATFLTRVVDRQLQLACDLIAESGNSAGVEDELIGAMAVEGYVDEDTIVNELKRKRLGADGDSS